MDKILLLKKNYQNFHNFHGKLCRSPGDLMLESDLLNGTTSTYLQVPEVKFHCDGNGATCC